MVEADRNGSHPLYRQRDWEEQERRDHKAKKKMNWITRGGFDTVIRVNPTPGGELAKQLQKVLDTNPGPVKVKIQELGGTKVKNLLQKPNPTKTRGCDSKDCLACKNGRGEIMLAMFSRVMNVESKRCHMWERLGKMYTREAYGTWLATGANIKIPCCRNMPK